MAEYKVINFGTPYLQDELNRLAKQGWRVVSSHFEPHEIGRPATVGVILERNTDAQIDNPSGYVR